MKIIRSFFSWIDNYNQEQFFKQALSKLFLTKVTDSHLEISPLNSKSKSKPRYIFWKDVDDVKLEEKKLLFIRDQTTFYTIDKDYCIGWYHLIQEIPTGFKSYDYTYVKNFFKSLKGCEICGLNAVSDRTCLYCDYDTWSDDLLKSFNSKEAYIKQSQLEHFDPGDEDEPIELNNTPKSTGFTSNPDWKPLISEADIKQFIRTLQ